MSKIEEKVENLISDTVCNLGYSIYDVMYVKEGQNYFLRIFIDSPNGISLNDCEKVNDAISDMIDKANYIKEQYFLEISSPGVERHIRSNKHLQLNLNQQINVKCFKPINKQKEFTGVLTNFDDESITLEIEKNIINISKNNISSMKRAFNWN